MTEEHIGKVTFCKDDLLGEGRFGAVFKGKYGSLPEVAVKRVKKAKTRLDPKSLPKVGVPALPNTNVVRLFGTEEDGLGNIFIVTEFCVGSLVHLVTGTYTGMEIGSDREILLQITQGLAYLHNLNICHGDLKPSNILISKPQGSEKPQMKLCDFALLHLNNVQFEFFDDKKFRPASTEGWMIPGSKLDFAFDIFSLGLCFTYLLTRGLHAFGEDVAVRNQLMKKKNMSMLLTVDDFTRHNAELAFAIVERMLRADAKRRPTVSEVLACFYLRGPTEKPKIVNHPIKPEVQAKPSIKRVKENEKIPCSISKRAKKESWDKDDHKTPKRRDRSSQSSKISTRSSKKVNEEDFLEKKKTRKEKGSSTFVGEGTPPASTNQHDSSEGGLIPVSQENASSEVIPAVTMLSPPNTVTPFENGSLQDGSDAHPDFSSFNSPETAIGSETSSKDEEHDEMLGAADSPQAQPEVEVTRPIIKIPRKSARLANAQNAQPLTTVLIQEENQQQATGRKISVLTPPPEFKTESNFPLLSVQNENLGFKSQKSLVSNSILKESFGDSQQVSQPITNSIRCTNLTQKETELLNLCSNWSLDDVAVERLRVLSSDKHVNVNCLDPYDRTPLLLICIKNRSNSLLRALQVLLLRDSVSVNAIDREGFSALALVCLHDGGMMMIEVIQLLLRHGANIHALSNQGWSVLYALFSNFNGRVHKLLDITKTLISSGVEVNIKAKDGSNALIALCSDYSHRSNSDFVAVLNLLILNKIQLNVTDASFRSVLHILCAEYTGSNLVEIVRMLVRAGIKLDLKDDDGKTAYEIMVELGNPNLEILQLLQAT